MGEVGTTSHSDLKVSVILEGLDDRGKYGLSDIMHSVQVRGDLEVKEDCCYSERTCNSFNIGNGSRGASDENLGVKRDEISVGDQSRETKDQESGLNYAGIREEWLCGKPSEENTKCEEVNICLYSDMTKEQEGIELSLQLEKSSCHDCTLKQGDGRFEYVKEGEDFSSLSLPPETHLHSMQISTVELFDNQWDITKYKEKLFVDTELMDDYRSVSIHGGSNVVAPTNSVDIGPVLCGNPSPELRKEADSFLVYETSFVEKDLCNLLEGANVIASVSTTEVVDNNLNLPSSTVSISPSDFQETDTFSATVADFCDMAESSGFSDLKHPPIVFVRRSNPKRAASMKASHNNMPFQRVKSKSNLSGSKLGGVSDPFLSTTIRISLKGVSRRRSFLNRRAHSPWGALDTLHDIFEKYSAYLHADSGASQNLNNKLKKAKYTSRKKIQRRHTECLKSQVLNSTDPATSPSLALSEETTLPWNCGDNCLRSDGCKTYFDAPKEFDVPIRLNTADNICVRAKSVKHENCIGDKDMESIVTQDSSFETVQGYYRGDLSRACLEAAEDDQLPDPGTSPDSVVFHPVMDATAINSEVATSKDLKDEGHGGILSLDQNGSCEYLTISSEVSQTLISVLPKELRKCSRPKQSNEGKNNCASYVGRCSSSKYSSNEENFQCPQSSKKERKTRKHGNSGWKKLDTSATGSLGSSKFIKRKPKKASGSKKFPLELKLSGQPCNTEDTRVDKEKALVHSIHNLESSARVIGDSPDFRSGETSALYLKASVAHLDCSESVKCIPREKKGNLRQMNNGTNAIHGVHKQDTFQVVNGDSSHNRRRMENILALDGSRKLGKKGSRKVSATDGKSSSALAPFADKQRLEEFQQSMDVKPLPTQSAWVLCDDCQKWRCIPAELADIIDGTNRRWTCNENNDKAYADCSIPQEKTNAQINAELQISDEEDCSNKHSIVKATQSSTIAASTTASWRHIKSNIFLHRNRKTQTIDEIMVCHCKRSSDGSLGCGEECLNRMLNIECIQGTCPCGDLCSNQQFQKRKYVRCKCYPCGKKGHGLQLLQNVSKGEFLIEYVGEVLDIATYEARQKYYASRGQKHFYFMTLNGGEVIDACAKGNVGRFINHSCDPNCQTEKWMVNGEVCIGLFAIRDIKKGEELTFDYNYVRVFGAAAKKCVCGSLDCRGIIGADSSSADVIVHGDSDEELCEPVMVHEDSDDAIDDFVGIKSVKFEECSLPSGDKIDKVDSIVCKTETCSEEIAGNGLFELNFLQTLEASYTKRIEDGHPPKIEFIESGTRTPGISKTEEIEETHQCKPTSLVSQTSPTNTMAASNLIIEKPTFPMTHIVDKSHSHKRMKKVKTKKVPLPVAKEFLNEVEGKLNQLLDDKGGISKRRDSTKGYLKLLFITATEDDFRDCAAQSMRNSSLILDALLKTESRPVLTDIINKNGLQMLHNLIMKNRVQFNRIPIIRKLLKVLVFLVKNGALTPEHMCKDPLCHGKESFRNSIWKLTKHEDMQINRMARDLLHNHIPRGIRRVEPSDRDDCIFELEHERANNMLKPWATRNRADYGGRASHAIICVSGASDSLATSNEPENTHMEHSVASTVHDVHSNSAPLKTEPTRRKRKSRWDQPKDQAIQVHEDKFVEPYPKLIKSSAEVESVFPEENTGSNTESQRRENVSSCHNEPASKNGDTDGNPSSEEVPPGFCLAGKDSDSHRASDVPQEVHGGVLGVVQEKYLAHVEVSYGIPVALMEQIGTLVENAGNHQCHQKWVVAPGMPFHPFPPLPDYPRVVASTFDTGSKEPKPASQTHESSCAAERACCSTSDEANWARHQSRCSSTRWRTGHQPQRPSVGSGNQHVRGCPPGIQDGQTSGFRGFPRNLTVKNHKDSGRYHQFSDHRDHRDGNSNFYR